MTAAPISPAPANEMRQALWAFRKEFFIVGALSLMVNVLMLSPTLYMLQVFDRVTISGSELTLLALSLLTLVLFAIMGLAEWLRSRVLILAGVEFDKALSSRVFNASFHTHLNQAALQPTRAFTDLVQLRQFITGNGVFAFFDMPWAPVYIVVLFLLHPMLGWLSIAFACVQALIAWYSHRKSQQPIEQLSLAEISAQSYLQSKLRNAEVVEAMGMGPQLKARWLQLYATHRALSSTHAEQSSRTVAASKFVRYTQQSLALAAGALLVIDGQISAGAMIAANVLMTRALAPIDMLASTWRGMLTARSAYTRLVSLLQQHPESDPQLRQAPPTGDVKLIHLSAIVPTRPQPILTDINLHLSPGQTTVLMGPSGSGKSTLAKVIMGVHSGYTGQVLLDDIPLQSWSRNDLGPHIGYLPQDIELFEGTIAQNIARFDTVDPFKVIYASGRTGLHEAILRFPKGYDTPIGEAGSLLSGGQRQRLGLARALYGEPHLVVLDEPNANLDDAGEAALTDAIRLLQETGCTVLLISHRPAAIALADQLVILNDGRITHSGPREQVLQQLRLDAAPAQPTAPTQPAQS